MVSGADKTEVAVGRQATPPHPPPTRQSFTTLMLWRLRTFVEQEVALLDDVLVEGVFRLPPDSVVDLLSVHDVGEDLLLMLRRM